MWPQDHDSRPIRAHLPVHRSVRETMKREVKSLAWAAPRVPWLRVAWVEAWESRHLIRRVPRWALALGGVGMLLLPLPWEPHTGILEPQLSAHWAKRMTYYTHPGPANEVVFPKAGPADVR